MSAKQLNPAYDGMTDQQVKRFKYWEFRTMAMCIFGYALFYFVRKNPVSYTHLTLPTICSV